MNETSDAIQLTDTDRDVLRAVQAGVVIHITNLTGPDTYESTDGSDLDFDILDRLAGLGLIAWRSSGVGVESRERIELTEDGEEQVRAF